ncbi:MAG TPA: ABC transporter permease subunit [Burkholderiaceae bacterium]|jgi:polar amino acid transport system substrate-binding protein|nr:ABC transporter permease subunit [Burkholderiaceae bacterium]
MKRYPVFRFLLSILLFCTAGQISLCHAQASGAASSNVHVAHSDRLALIRERGAIIVGVKTDYAPYGMLNSAGMPVGFEHDLAEDIAKRLGVKLRKVSVTGSNRLQKLQDGTVDLVLATTGDTAERRKIATMIEPGYYASGVTLFMRPDTPIKNWTDTRGKPVCATQGSYFNRAMQQRYLMDLQMYNNDRDAKLAVRDGRCVGYLFDDTAINNDLANPEWKGYKALLPATLNNPWAIAISMKERGTEFEQLLGDIVADWHRSGFLEEREKSWGIPPSKFLSQTDALWQKTDDDGQPYCRRLSDGHWRAECRNQVFLTSADVGGLAQFGLWLNETTGIDLTPVYDSFDRAQFLHGLIVTFYLTFLCIVCSLMFGWIGAVCGESGHFLLAPVARCVATLGRMTPPLLSIYLIFFGLGSVLNKAFGISLPAFAVAVGCLSAYAGSGIMNALLVAAATHRLQHPDFHLRFTNIWQLARLASGSITASLINVSKATMMASVIAVPELLSATTTIIAERGNVGVMMNVLLLIFLGIVFAVVGMLRYLEQKMLTRVA